MALTPDFKNYSGIVEIRQIMVIEQEHLRTGIAENRNERDYVQAILSK